MGSLMAAMLPTEENVLVGSVIRLISDRKDFVAALDASGLEWDEDMSLLLGTQQEVVDLHAIDPELFGLAACSPSEEAVWWYPLRVIADVSSVGQPESNLNEATLHPP